MSSPFSSTANELWKHRGDEVLPEWDIDICFGLFLAHTTRQPTETERNGFARQIQQLIALNFGRLHTATKLRSVGLDPRHVAQDLASFICDRVGRFKLKTPRPKVLISALNHTLQRKLADAFDAARPTLSSDIVGEVFAAPARMPDLDGLAHHLRRKDTIMGMIAGVPGDIGMLLRLVRHQREQILHSAGPARRDELPERARRCSHEQHALVVARLLSVVRQWIAHRAEVQH
jgi:hypothetical protein